MHGEENCGPSHVRAGLELVSKVPVARNDRGMDRMSAPGNKHEQADGDEDHSTGAILLRHG